MSATISGSDSLQARAVGGYGGKEGGKPAVQGYPSGQASEVTAAGSGGTASERAQTSLNIAIVQSSMSVSLSSGNEPLALLYKSAINSINETLAPEFGENAIQNAAGQDNSPEATAERIVKLATGFYEAYKQQNPGEDESKTLNSFMDTIKRGFEQGFKEASDILQGLNVLKDDIASGIQKTYDLVQKGFADFASANAPKGDAETPPSPA